MIIREYLHSDEKGVIKLWANCGLLAPQNNPAKDIERKLAVDPELFLVGCHEGALVATVMGGYEGHRGWINYLAVSPQEQKQGFGRQLMEEIESRLRAKGCPKINLQVRTGNASTIAFYTALGYGNDDVVSFGKRLEHD